jgi:hypothetical protein
VVIVALAASRLALPAVAVTNARDETFKEGQLVIERQHSRRHILKWGSLLGALGALRIPLPAFADTKGKKDKDEAIAGSWIVSVAYAASSDRTRGLATFISDGGFVGSISAFEGPPERPTPSRGTTLHGSWRRTGRREYALTAARLHLDEQGSLLGVMKTRICLALEEDLESWSGTFSFDAMDPAGVVLRSEGGTVQGTRISVESD